MSLGWEKRIAHWLPIHSWKSIGPWVVCAVKFGASSPIRKAIGASFLYARAPNRNALAAFAPAVIPCPRLYGVRSVARFVCRVEGEGLARFRRHIAPTAPMTPNMHPARTRVRSEEHTSELQSPCNLVCRLLLEKKKKKQYSNM